MMLEAKNIHRAYRNAAKSIEVLKGIDLIVPQSQFIAITGPSGAGKSTLLHILGGLDTPNEGSVVFEGRDMYGLSEGALCEVRNSSIGFVFQFYHLLPEFNALENAMMPALFGQRQKKSLSSGAKEQALSLLAQAGLIDRADHYPAQLSGGEQQRVAIVRALINRPKLLLCDEPTGNLDSRTGGEIIGLIRKISKGSRMTVVLVTHNIELANLADKVYNLNDGILLG